MRVHEPFGIDVDRHQPSGQGAYLGYGLLQTTGKFGCQFMLGLAGLVEQAGRKHTQSGKLLSQAIVQFLSDAALLTYRDLQDFAL